MIIKLKKAIAKNFKDLAFYFNYLRYRIFLAVFLSIGVGILDGFGLTMFLPLLQMISDPESVGSDSLGSLSIIVEGIEALGISLSLISILAIMIFFFALKGIAVFLNSYYRTIIRQLFIKQIRENI